MTAHGRIGSSGRPRAKRTLGVQAALEWAFQVERARLELPPRKNVSGETYGTYGFGLEYVLLKRTALGCKVDSGLHKIGGSAHPDAEVIAATVAELPDSFGDKRMAIRVAELARAGLTPEWMPGAVPQCVPVEILQNEHGERSATIVVGLERVLTRERWRSVEVLACPVAWRPHPEQIASALRGYEDW
jgi:hypothetical protein